MNASNQIDISKSSLVGLKAELLKKQEEVKRLKELQKDNVKPDIIQKKKSIQQQKSNDGVEERRAKDVSVVEEDYDALKKSREVLEAKARLYDKLKGKSVDEETKSKYLIDFDLKRDLEKESLLNSVQDENTENSENEEDYSDSNSDPENDWVDFVDALGRSRRCLKKDLQEMRAKDAKLAATLHPPSPPPDTTPTPTPELLSWDMQREMMRKKWEEQETLLLGKKDIHYQDVRFDEARPHGVGYFEFSTDEAERVRQQQELQKLRAQTEQQQEAAQGLRARREQQMQARLAAARQRRRERLGLPPESPPHETEPIAITDKTEEKCVEQESIIDLEESIKKIAPIRPWDIGKNREAPVMSQEEWIEKKRQERPAEFAPPSSITGTIDLMEDNIEQKWKSNPNFFTSKKPKEQFSFNETSKKKHKRCKVKKKGKKGPQKEVEENEEESFGPSVKDWQEISQQNNTVLSDNIASNISNSSIFEGSKISSINSLSPTEESRNNYFPTPAVKEWKPTITDIDLLLSKSRAASCNTSDAEDSKNHRFSQDITTFSGTKESLGSVNVDIESAVKKGNMISSGSNIDIVKSGNFEYPKFTHPKRTNNHKSSTNQRSEPIDNSGNCEHIVKPIDNLLDLDSDDEVDTSKLDESSSGKWKSSKRKFAEIPPPPSMSYYIDADKKNNKPNTSIKPQLADSISAGINYLRSQTEEKSKKRLKGMLDIM